MDYQSNSRRDKEGKERPRPEKVVVSEVIQRPVSLGFKFKNIFLGDNLKTTSAYVVNEIFWPQTRVLIFDIFVEGLRNMIFQRGGGPRRPTEARMSRISYDNPFRSEFREPPRPDYRDASMYRDARARSNPPDQYGRRTRPEPTEIIIATREEADAVLERMVDILNTYESVSLADYYDILGLAASPVDNTWGWTILNTSKVIQTRDGFVIQLPRMEVLPR